MESSVKNRLMEFIASQGLSQREFERSINASNGFVKSIRKGIGGARILKIKEQYPHLNIEWLLHGTGEMIKPINANVANIDTNNGTLNQGTSNVGNQQNGEKALYEKIIELLEEKIANLQREKDELLRRHNCPTMEDLERKLNELTNG